VRRTEADPQLPLCVAEVVERDENRVQTLQVGEPDVGHQRRNTVGEEQQRVVHEDDGVRTHRLDRLSPHASVRFGVGAKHAHSVGESRRKEASGEGRGQATDVSLTPLHLRRHVQHGDRLPRRELARRHEQDTEATIPSERSSHETEALWAEIERGNQDHQALGGTPQEATR
jgi:hypothetical protein